MGCASSSAAAAQQPRPQAVDVLHWHPCIVHHHSTHSLQHAPTLLSKSNSRRLARSKSHGLLKVVLEEASKDMLGCSKKELGLIVNELGRIVNDVHQQAHSIIQQHLGLGPSGECPFASAVEVELYYKFCLKVCDAWSDHKLGENQEMDEEFYSQINKLCEVLGSLDTDIDGVPLPRNTEQHIQLLQEEILFPKWIRGQAPKGEASVRRCLAIGRKWELEETEAFKEALAWVGSHH